MNRCRRSLFVIDHEVQGALMMRVAFYWLFCLLSIVLMVVCWNIYTGPSRPFAELFLDIYHRYGTAMIASLILLPIVMMDVARMSNRFVGPVVKLRAALKEVAEGRPAQPLNFRDQDYWRGLATDFNRAAGRLVQNSAELSRPTEAMPPEEASV